MSVDKIFNWLRTIPEPNENIRDNNLGYFIRRDFSHTDSTCLYICTPSWGGKFKEVPQIKEKVIESKDSFLTYEFPREILSSDADLTNKCFGKIQDLVCIDLEDLKKHYKFSKLNLISTSLGCVNACMIANAYSQIDTLTLFNPGHCLAESLWKGIRTAHFRKQFEDKHITLNKLKKLWYNLAPENNLNNLNNTKIHISLSTSDEVIPYECGKKLVKTMKDKGLQQVVKENEFPPGHYGSIWWYYCLFPDDIVSNGNKK